MLKEAHCCSTSQFIQQGNIGFGKPNCHIEILEWEIYFLCFMSVQHAISFAGASMKNHYIPEMQPLGKSNQWMKW